MDGKEPRLWMQLKYALIAQEGQPRRQAVVVIDDEQRAQDPVRHDGVLICPCCGCAAAASSDLPFPTTRRGRQTHGLVQMQLCTMPLSATTPTKTRTALMTSASSTGAAWPGACLRTCFKGIRRAEMRLDESS